MIKNHNTRAQERREGLTASEALYGFCGWITSRKERVCASATDNAAVWADLIKEFCEVNKLETPRQNWTDYLSHPAQLAKGQKEPK